MDVMRNTRMIFCSDVHLCHANWFGRSSADRMENMITQLNQFCQEKPCEKIVFLGDYSLDFWVYDIGGSVLREGLSNTTNFVRNYANRLNVPYHMAPGNHEQYGYENWMEITGTPREDAFVVGGYLIITCDNFSGLLDPAFHSDGVYTPTKLDFIRKKMSEFPHYPVILCGHFFDIQKEPSEFFRFLKDEKRITLLICGHDHVANVDDLGEEAGHVCLYHDGQYSYSGNGTTPYENMWGFCEAILTDDGIDIRYVEPANTVEFDGNVLEHPYRERVHRFFPRRDI